MRFWLGVHRPHWLALTDVGLMVSHRTLAPRKSLPVAAGPWVLDSGGYSELSMFGRWMTPTDEYVEAIGRYGDEIGHLEWAAPQDWMCEPWITAKTGLSVEEHQQRTVDNYLEMVAQAPVIAVLQGWTIGDYDRHVAMYDQAGIDLRTLPIVGLGSVCRRGATHEIVRLVERFTRDGIQLHGFGIKRDALRKAGWLFASSDSMAWSYTARHRPALDGCTHRACANCLRYALRWRLETLRALEYQQPSFDLEVAR